MDAFRSQGETRFVGNLLTRQVEMVFAFLAAGSWKTGGADRRCFPCQRFQKRDQQGDFREALAT